MSTETRCPSCGGPCTFKVASALVAVCPYCKSVIGRTDKGLEDLGRVADLVETQSPLDLWLKGRFDGVPFSLTGRTQYRHPAGGVWDEWYASFSDGRWGWLAEAQGKFYLTFEKPAPPDLPSYDALELGQKVKVSPDLTLLVAEKNRGQTAGAQGEIPFRLIPGTEHPFADLSGPRGAFGTLDYSEGSPTLYLGREVTLDELGIPASARRKVYPGQEPRIEAVALNCPQCGGALQLRAPDKSERVGCPNCGSLLDVQQGQLKLLQSLKPPPIQPIIPLGSKGNYDHVEWMVIGFMQRAVRLDNEDYFWEEYLLYHPRKGFRWLTRSDDHWNWVEPLPAGAVSVEGNYANYADRPYRLYQRAKARVVFVLGEFYWKVQAGEKVSSRDFVNPPYILSEEATKEGKEGEINWSRGTYLPPEQVQAMFKLPALPQPADVAPNQPFPYTGIYWISLWLATAALVLAGVVWLFSPHRTVLQERITLTPAGAAQTTTVPLEPFELKSLRNICITLESSSPGWIYLEGQLVPAPAPPEPGVARKPASAPRDRRFSLGSVNGQPMHTYLSSVPAGRYALQCEARWQNLTENHTIGIRVEQGVAHPAPLVITLLLIGAWPFVIGLYQIYFESRRWQNSSIQ